MKCPKCGWGEVRVDRRASALCSDFIGDKEIVITCLKCGHEFMLEQDD